MRTRASHIGILLITIILYAAVAYMRFAKERIAEMVWNDKWPRPLPYPDTLLEDAAAWLDSLSPPTPSYHAGWSDLAVLLDESSILMSLVAGAAFAACLFLRNRDRSRSLAWRAAIAIYIITGGILAVTNVSRCAEPPGFHHRNTPQLVNWFLFYWPAITFAAWGFRRLFHRNAAPPESDSS